MRMLVLKQGQDLQSLATRLGAAGGAASIERLKALNPHLDLGRLQPGAGSERPGHNHLISPSSKRNSPTCPRPPPSNTTGVR